MDLSVLMSVCVCFVQMLISSKWFYVAVVSGCVMGHFCSRHAVAGNKV